jgi:hypothetical protein
MVPNESSKPGYEICTGTWEAKPSVVNGEIPMSRKGGETWGTRCPA